MSGESVNKRTVRLISTKTLHRILYMKKACFLDYCVSKNGKRFCSLINAEETKITGCSSRDKYTKPSML